MKKSGQANLFVAGCAIFLSTAYLIATFGIRDIDIVDPLGPKAFPFLLGIGMLVCGIALAITTFVRAPSAISTIEANEETRSHPLAVTLVGFWLLAYYLTFEPLGFLLTTMIFLLGLTMYFNRGRWVLNVAVSVLFPISLDLIFSYVLGRAPAPGLFSF
jgi:putative tricarboxylic transport membrane protein